jgi:hypothetical protein
MAKPTASSPSAAPNAVFKRSTLFKETFDAALMRGREALLSAFESFLKTKLENPMQPFGSRDGPFKGTGILKTAVPGETLIHAHLLHDMNIVYSMSGRNPTVFKLYAVYSHDDLGTGQPANIKKQKQVAKKFANTDFS